MSLFDTIGSLLGKSEAELSEWRDALLEALGMPFAKDGRRSTVANQN